MGTLYILGPFRFSAQTTAPDEVARSSRWDWQEVDRVGIAPALQFTGAQNETMTLSGRLVPGFSGGREQLARMRAIADLGLPMPLIDGTGQVLGLWVIEQVDETGSRHFQDGYPKLIAFNIGLKKYGEGSGLFGQLSKVSKIISLFS